MKFFVFWYYNELKNRPVRKKVILRQYPTCHNINMLFAIYINIFLQKVYGHMQISLLDRGIWILQKTFFCRCDLAYTSVRLFSISLRVSFILYARYYAPPYLHTSLLTYFDSPITPISLLSDAIHHRSGFSPRLPHPTYLGMYVLLLCCHSSHPCPLRAFHLHSLSSGATTHFFFSTNKCTTYTQYNYNCESIIVIGYRLQN